MRINVGKNAKRNILVGVANKIVILILPFITRSIINTTLGAEYLGLNSLFTSILHVLLLSELGFSTALVYNMYKPIAQNDQVKINALLNLYRTAYRIIGCVILGIGCILIPLLPRLITGSYPEGINIVVVYLLQLFNTSISYFLFGYKQSLLAAYQREDVNSIINLFIQLSMQTVQIIILVTTRNYYLYIVCMPIFTIITNLWIGYITKRMFPDAKCMGKLDRDTLSNIKQLVAGTFISRACSITRNSLDSICISAFIGLVTTASYNNYYTIFNGITILLGVISTALTGGIGNHVEVKNVDENFEELRNIDFLYMTIAGICTICLLCLYQPFIKLWMGEKLMLPMKSVVLLCIYFYVMKMGDMRTMYSTANGLWWKHRYRSICETIANITLNIFLGKRYGVDGIIIATIISIFICNQIWGSTIVFKNYFKGNKIIRYYTYHIKYLCITLIISFFVFYITSLVSIDNSWLDLIVKATICFFSSSFLYAVIYFKTNIFKNSIKMIIGRKI